MSITNFLQSVSVGGYDYREHKIGTPGGAGEVGKYGIDSRSWAGYATAAGIPGARWTDPRAQDMVAVWIGNDLHSKLGGDWGLVAIAFRYGTEAARTFQTQQHSGYAPDMNNTHMSLYTKTNGDVPSVAMPTGPGPAPTGRRGGGGEVFTQQEQPTEEEMSVRPVKGRANNALLGVLQGMADSTAGGQRLAIEDVDVQEVPGGDVEALPPENVEMTEVQP